MEDFVDEVGHCEREDGRKVGWDKEGREKEKERER